MVHVSSVTLDRPEAAYSKKSSKIDGHFGVLIGIILLGKQKLAMAWLAKRLWSTHSGHVIHLNVEIYRDYCNGMSERERVALDGFHFIALAISSPKVVASDSHASLHNPIRVHNCNINLRQMRVFHRFLNAHAVPMAIQ